MGINMYMSRKELLSRPFLVLLRYMDGKSYTEILIPSLEKEPEYYYPYNMLIIPGSRARRTAFGGFELSHIYFNLEDGITGNSYYVETSGYGEGIYLLDEPYNDYITYNDKIYTWDDLPTLTKEIGIRNIERTLEELE